MLDKPALRPSNPCFSSGPCRKRPGWSLSALSEALVGRSHRSKSGKARLREVIDLHRETLEIPADYRIGIVPASDTGAVEMAMWTLLGARGVDVLAWESFGLGWAGDAKNSLRLDDLRIFTADYGRLPDLSQVDCDRDVVFTWNGTTSGVRVPNGDWIAPKRQGLTICDATSAVFAMSLPWDRLDVVTWSWQKVLGSEGAHGMIVLSPRAVARLESHAPARPIPKIFRLTKGGAALEEVFAGETINTPSMLAVEDVLDALRWAKNLGGWRTLRDRSEANLATIEAWVASSPWSSFLAETPDIRSCTSICLKISAPWFKALPPEKQAKAAKKIVSLLDGEGVAYDIGSYRDAPPGLRLWGGATVEASDLKALCPWLDWAYERVAAEHGA